MAASCACAGSYSTVTCLLSGSPDMKRTPGSFVTACSMVMMQWAQEMSGASRVAVVIGSTSCRDDTAPDGQPHGVGMRVLLDRVVEGRECEVIAGASERRLEQMVRQAWVL